MRFKKLAIGALVAVVAVCAAAGFSACGSEDEHTHTAGSTWYSDATNHWQLCVADGCDTEGGAVMNQAAHTEAAEWTEAEDGSFYKACTVCGYVMETKEAEVAEHVHTAGTTWYSDETNHWNLCVADGCDTEGGAVMNQAAHTEAEDWTEAEDGSFYKACTVCGYVMETKEAEPVLAVIAEGTASSSLMGMVNLYGLYQEYNDGTAVATVCLSSSLLDSFIGTSSTAVRYTGTYETGSDEGGDYTVFTIQNIEYIDPSTGDALSSDALSTVSDSLYIVSVGDDGTVTTYTAEDTEADHTVTLSMYVIIMDLDLQFEVSSTDNPTDADAWLASYAA